MATLQTISIGKYDFPLEDAILFFSFWSYSAFEL
jgi:hypothetical protein